MLRESGSGSGAKIKAQISSISAVHFFQEKVPGIGHTDIIFLRFDLIFFSTRLKLPTYGSANGPKRNLFFLIFEIGIYFSGFQRNKNLPIQPVFPNWVIDIKDVSMIKGS